MAKYTNNKGISLPLAVWLARDEYKHDPRENLISVTTLMKSTRQIVLGSRLAASDKVEDISTRLPSRLGTAIHNAVEDAWVENHRQGLLDLGYPEQQIDKVRMNPAEPCEEKSMDVHFEVRTEKVVGKWIISGQFDICINGIVNDIKTTKVYTYTHNTSDKKYVQQMSLYKWLNPDLITKEYGAIQFLFTDWNQNMAHQAGYPPLPVMEHKLPLDSLNQTDSWVKGKLSEIQRCWDLPEPELPLCNAEELWQSKPQFKVYLNATSKRAVKVCGSMHEAQLELSKRKRGIIREIPSKPTACLYCPAASKCSQYERFVRIGAIK